MKKTTCFSREKKILQYCLALISLFFSLSNTLCSYKIIKRVFNLYYRRKHTIFFLTLTCIHTHVVLHALQQAPLINTLSTRFK